MVVRRGLVVGNNWMNGYEETSSTESTTSTMVTDDPEISIHPLSSQEGVIVKIEPPRCPSEPELSQVACDIVLVIDISFSMSKAAPIVGLNDNGHVTKEHAGLSVLDITKHAALTVLETLGPRDRLGIVTFSTAAKVVQPLLPMSQYNKAGAARRIRALKEENSTNLWQGIVQGLKLFELKENSGNVPAMLVLTDGQPNYQNPLQGYVTAIRNMAPLPATIHTFGFGNDLKSGLLKSIAEIGSGSYSFIPDSGMVGTVFVNAVAHLQSTFANRCTLELTFPDTICLRQTFGETVECREEDNPDYPPHEPIFNMDGTKRQRITINLGNLQYGQSRDIYFSSDSPDWSRHRKEKLQMTAELRFSRMFDSQYIVKASQNALQSTSMPKFQIAYHQSRAMVCEYLSSFFPLRADGEHEMPRVTTDFNRAARGKFNRLVARIPAKGFSDDYNRTLLQDLLGQVKLAVFDNTYMMTWGPHYFLSLWDAHAKQVRNTFKDPGVQMYDCNSPLFLKCQKKLTYAFDTTVKPPEPSLRAQADEKYTSGRAVVTMSSYNNCDYPCFSASTAVTLASGKKIPVSELRKGIAVLTPVGSRKVVAVLKTRVRKITLCRVQRLLVTPWHPIVEGDSWTFPAKVAQKAVRYSGAIYSILLEPDANPEAHALQVGGVWAVTLGHGIISGKDARAHEFLGNYAAVCRAFSLVEVNSNGVAVASGVRREKRTGRLNGFRKSSCA